MPFQPPPPIFPSFSKPPALSVSGKTPTSIFDELNLLHPTSIGGVSFPSTIVKTSNSKALALHMYPNRDGARIENMGANPRKFSIRAVMTNNVYPSNLEDWPAGDLFPTQFTKLEDVLNINLVQKFVHPIYGNTFVMVDSWEVEVDGDKPRDGVFVSISLIETINDNEIVNPATTTIGNTAQQASACDAAFATVPSPPGLSLIDMFTRIAATLKTALAYPNTLIAAVNAQILQVTSTATALENSPSAILNNTLYLTSVLTNTVNNAISNQINFIKNPFAQFSSVVGNRAALTSQTIGSSPDLTVNTVKAIINLNYNPSKNAYDFISKAINTVNTMIQYYNSINTANTANLTYNMCLFLYQLQQAQLSLPASNTTQSSSQTTSANNPIVATYTTLQSITFPLLAAQLGNNVEDIVSLNPSLSKALFIPPNVKVNYYVQ